MDLRAAGLDSGNVWFSRTTDIDAAYDYAERSRPDRRRGLPGSSST